MIRPGRASSLAIGLAVVAVVVLAVAHAGQIRARAETALAAGMPPRETQLARGFVLGDDAGVDPQTVSDFRRAGLSHLLAVSGENVALLGLLALPLLAVFGLPLRARLLWVLGSIAVYVPLTGAGPSIQRAGVMGALSLLATLAGRRSSRLYALFVAALATIAIDPGVAADVGWQLSFAAVLGILALASPLAGALATRLELGAGAGRGLTDGLALTTAATLATAPLIAFHFGELSTVGLVANLLAMPAVAPAMWLGMLASATGQVPGFPVAAVDALAAPLYAYIAQVAAWCGRPAWASVAVRLGIGGLAASYAAMVLGAVGLPWLLRRRRLARVRARRRPAAPLRSRVPAARVDGPIARLLDGSSGHRGGGRVLAVVAALALATFAWAGAGEGTGPGPARGLRVSILDVGQGDAILLQPGGADPVLVDGGPPGDGLEGLLRAAGVGELGAAIVTHDQSDHAGGVDELLGRLPIRRLLFGVLDRPALAAAHAAGARTARIAAGCEVRSGGLRLDVIWPPRVLLAGSHAGEDPNLLALVMVARWRRFSILLTADAEAESTPVDPGPIDVLKVAHHGSDDAGLADLLDRTRPRLAVISVGAGNPYGHPTAATLATLASHGVPVLRTDRDGTVVLDVGAHGVVVRHG
jgi:competence protein ComEC